MKLGKFGTLQGAAVIQVIEVRAKKGDGIEGSPVRHVTYYYAFDGTLLAERDECSQPPES